MQKLITTLLLVCALAMLGTAQTSYPSDPNAAPGQPNTNPNAQTADPNSTSFPPDTQVPANGQSAAPSPQSGTVYGSNEVTPGTEIRATLDQALSTKNSKEGDSFTATVAQPVTGANGQVLIPAGSKIRGEVANSEQGKILTDIRGKGRLNLRFRDIELPSGGVLPLTATLKSVNSTQGANTNAKTNEEGELSGGTSGKTAAKDIGIGAAVGTVGGLIFGSALKGLAIGAIAGGGYVLATRGKDVELPARTGLILTVNQRIAVSPSGGGGMGGTAF